MNVFPTLCNQLHVLYELNFIIEHVHRYLSEEIGVN